MPYGSTRAEGKTISSRFNARASASDPVSIPLHRTCFSFPAPDLASVRLHSETASAPSPLHQTSLQPVCIRSLLQPLSPCGRGVGERGMHEAAIQRCPSRSPLCPLRQQSTQFLIGQVAIDRLAAPRAELTIRNGRVLDPDSRTPQAPPSEAGSDPGSHDAEAEAGDLLCLARLGHLAMNTHAA